MRKEQEKERARGQREDGSTQLSSQPWSAGQEPLQLVTKRQHGNVESRAGAPPAVHRERAWSAGPEPLQLPHRPRNLECRAGAPPVVQRENVQELGAQGRSPSSCSSARESLECRAGAPPVAQSINVYMYVGRGGTRRCSTRATPEEYQSSDSCCMLWCSLSFWGGMLFRVNSSCRYSDYGCCEV